MYNETDIATHIQTETGFNTYVAMIESIDEVEVTAGEPVVFVGHTGIKLANEQHFPTSVYDSINVHYILLTEIHYICLNSEWWTVRQSIYDSYKNWSPFMTDANYSTVGLVRSDKRAISGDKVWWTDLIGLVFPKIA